MSVVKTTKKIDKRVEGNTKSLFELRDYLQEIIKNPHVGISDEKLQSILKSQGALSKYENKSLGIFPSSINTIKRICEKSLDGGFDALDRLRIAALQALENERCKKNPGKKTTQRSMTDHINDLKKANQILQQDLLIMTQLLETAMRHARYYAAQSMQDNVRVLCEKEQKEIRAYLSLLAKPVTTNKVKLVETIGA